MKFRYLDGLRGLAAVVVVITHMMFMYVPYAVNGVGIPHGFGPLIHNTPLYLLVSGDLAVCIFFILSGIVLSAKFFRTGESRFVTATAVKRYFRLAIPVFGSVMLAYLALRLGWLQNQQAGTLSSDWWKAFWLFPANIWHALYEGSYGVFFTDNSTYNPVLWTMKLEFLGSFLVFGTILIFGKMRNRWVVYVALLALLWRTYYPAFILGAMICDYYFTGGKTRLRGALERGWWIPLLGVSLLLGSYPVTSAAGTMFDHLPFLPVQAHVVAALGIIVAVMSSGWIQRFLQSRPVLFLGRVSFSLYLVHFVLLGVVTSRLFVTLSEHMSLKSAMLVTVVPTWIVVLGAAYLYTRFVDEPAIRFSGWVANRWFNERADAKPAPDVAAAVADPGASVEATTD